MRKAILLGLAAVLGLCAQQQRQYEAYTYDGSGNRYGGRVYGETRRPGELSRTERVVSVNGRAVPLEQVEEKVILDTPGHKVVERVIHRYSQDGRPAGMEKVRIEERRDATGKRTTTATIYEGDVNGRFRLRERQVTEAVTKGKTLETLTRVERPSVNGSLKVVERRRMRQVERDNGLSREVTIYRPADGRFAPAAKEVTEVVREGNRETAVTTQYNTTATADGRMGFAGKTVKEIVRRPDGSERQVVSVYGASAPGRPISEGGREQLREQILVEKQVQADGSVVERTGVRRVSLSDPNRLEAYQPVSEVICRGNCLPPPQPKAQEAQQQTAQAGGQEQQPQTSETAKEQRTVVIRDVVPPPAARPQPTAGPGAQPAAQPGPQGTPAAKPGQQPAPQPAAQPPRRREPVPRDRPDPKRGPGS